MFENFQDESLIKELMISYADLSTEIKHGISEIKYAPSVTNKDLVSLYMNDGNRVLVNIPQLSEKMAYYPQVAKQMDEAGIIDMEVGIFSYPYGNESTIESTNENSQSSDENY
ncbi:cell division protein FtsQ/DivIB [Enterococcus rivorum]|uniref:cell division protein FtsQ/DivIB n=1 Tax=Enterococcus rivorum TaxID=762845 RepID=UPI0036325044